MGGLLCLCVSGGKRESGYCGSSVTPAGHAGCYYGQSHVLFKPDVSLTEHRVSKKASSARAHCGRVTYLVVLCREEGAGRGSTTVLICLFYANCDSGLFGWVNPVSREQRSAHASKMEVTFMLGSRFSHHLGN